MNEQDERLELIRFQIEQGRAKQATGEIGHSDILDNYEYMSNRVMELQADVDRLKEVLAATKGTFLAVVGEPSWPFDTDSDLWSWIEATKMNSLNALAEINEALKT